MKIKNLSIKAYTGYRLCFTLFFYSFFLYFSSTSAICQNTKVDSLQEILQSSDLQDSTRIRLTFDLVDLIYYKDIPRTIQLLKDIEEPIKNSTIEYKFQHKFSMARGHAQMYKFDTAEILALESRSLISSDQFPREYAMAQSLLGQINESKGNLPKSIHLFKQAAPIFLELQDSFKYAATLNNLGLTYELQANYTAALEYYLTALPIFEELNVDRGVIAICKNIGLIKQKQRSFEEAIDYFKRGLKVATKTNDLGRMAGSFNDLGAIFMDLNQLDSAKYYLEKSEVLYKEIENDHGLSTIKNNIGKLYRLQNNCIKGIEYNEIALDIATNLKVIVPKIFALMELGTCHQELKNTYLANKYLNQALDIANKMGEVSMQFRVENALYKLHKNSNSAKALYHFEKSTSYRDSMFNKNKTEELKTIELNYEFDKERLISSQKIDNLEMQDELKNTRLKNKNYTILLLISFLIGVLLLSYLLWNNYRKNKALAYQENQLQKQKIEQLNKERKIMAMSSMIEGQETERARIAKDLHDGLGGLLSSVRSRLSNIDQQVKQIESYNVYERTAEIVDEACDEVRRISHNLLPGALRLEGLVSAVQSIGEDLSEVHGLKVKTEIFGFEKLKDETKSIFIYRIIQEATNNIIKYAKASEVFIQLFESEELLQIIVEDNGLGFDTQQDSKGLGLRSMASRVEYLKGEIDIDSELHKGTTISISIPK